METKFYLRDFTPPIDKSFFLFGPRGTGKTTWMRKKISPALYINLLRSSDFLEFESDPGLLRKQVVALPKKSWIFVDEIQKVPLKSN